MKRVFQTLAIVIVSAVALSAAQQTAPDNTKANKSETVTAQQQANNRSDTETSRLIRRAIVGDKSLSTYAHNVKVITKGGQVTLTGPVRTAEEKATVEAKAAEVAGAAHVVNQIEVAPSKTTGK